MDCTPTDIFSLDVVVVGAGPTGLACGIDAKRAGFTVANIDKGCLVNSLFNYPSNMTFFTTPELLEIGDIPFSSPNQKPTRQEALEYYRKVAEHYQLDVRQYEPVLKIEGSDNNFVVHTTNIARTQARVPRAQAHPRHRLLRSPKLHATFPAKTCPRCMHYYREPHPFFDLDVLIVGGKNSAAIAALELWRHGARVTLVHRGPGISPSVKYWIKPDIENRIKAGQVKAYFNSTRARDHAGARRARHARRRGHAGERLRLRAHRLSSRLRVSVLHSASSSSGEADKKPIVDPQTLESNVPGIYLAGVIVAGMRTSEIFIENGRFHGQLIAADLKHKLRAEEVPA